jgi:hypothetical protein
MFDWTRRSLHPVLVTDGNPLHLHAQAVVQLLTEHYTAGGRAPAVVRVPISGA